MTRHTCYRCGGADHLAVVDEARVRGQRLLIHACAECRKQLTQEARARRRKVEALAQEVMP